MLGKKPIQLKQQFLLRYSQNREEVRKLKSLMKNQINIIPHLYFQKLLLLNKPDCFKHSGLSNINGQSITRLMTMLHVSFAKSTYKNLSKRKTKKMHFYVPHFITEKSLNKFQRSSTVKMSSCCTNIRSYSLSVSRCYCFANLFAKSRNNKNRMFGNFTKKDLQNNNNKLFAQFQYLFSFFKLVY